MGTMFHTHRLLGSIPDTGWQGCSIAAEIFSRSPVLPLAPRCQQSILGLPLCLLVSVLMQLGFSSPCFQKQNKQAMDPETQHKSPFCRQLPPLSLRNGTSLRDVPSFCYSLPKVSGAILPLSRALCGGEGLDTVLWSPPPITWLSPPFFLTCVPVMGWIVFPPLNDGEVQLPGGCECDLIEKSGLCR